jgi:hypothetical protein
MKNYSSNMSGCLWSQCRISKSFSLALSMFSALAVVVHAPAQSLRMMVPDFLQPASESPVTCLQSAGLPVMLESYPATNLYTALTNNLLSGTPPALAVVSDSDLASLDATGWLRYFTLDQAYFPVKNGTNIVGVRLPWASRWTAIVPITSTQWDAAVAVLTNSCIWQRPWPDVEETIALTSMLSSNGFTLSWGEQWSTNMALGGIPVEITVVPTDIVGTNYCRLILARDRRGNVYAQSEKYSSTMPKSTPPKTTAKKAIQTSLCTSTVQLQEEEEPGYCTKSANCLENLGTVLDSVLDWLTGGLSADELAAVGLRGRPSVAVGFNTDYMWGSRLRAWKIYKAITSTDGQNWKRTAGCTRTRVKNTITSGKGITFSHFLSQGFDVKGTQKLSICPPGYLYWNDPRQLNLNTHLANVYANVAQVAASSSAAMVNCSGFYYGDSDEATESDDWFDLLDAIPIDWEMKYDSASGILTVTYSIEGKLSWGAFDLCTVSLVGAGGGSIDAKLDGNEIHLEFKLEVYLQADCGIHPCVHGDIGGGLGAYLDITYPDPCSVIVSTKISLGWGGHGDAVGFQGEVCDVDWLQGPVWNYNLCSDDEVQSVLSTNTDFTGLYGSPVCYSNIQVSITNYQLPAVSGGGDTTWDPWWPHGHGHPAISSGYGSDWTASTTFVMPTVALPDNTVTVTIYAPWLENLGSATYCISYDPAVLDFQSVGNGSIGLVTIPATFRMAYPGQLNITNLIAGGVTGEGELATVFFHTRDPMRRSLVEMVNANFRDTHGYPLEVTHGRGCIDVIHPPITVQHEFSPPNFQLTWSSYANIDYVVQSSTNLVSWENVTTNAGTGSQLLYEATVDEPVQKFFRLQAMPH